MPNPRAVKEISIHALREEGDHRSLFRSAQKIDFYPRPPRGGRPTSSLPSWRGGNFYPRPPRGGRQAYKTDGWVGLAFLSTPSARRATWPAHRGRRQIPISIHALREEGDGPIRVGNLSDIEISIHALREEGDLPDGNVTDYLLSISIHALREEGDARSEFRLCITLRFLSTPSARRATVPLMVFQTPHTDFYPRPPRGGRQEPMKASVRHRLFLSTPSARRAT